MYSGNEGMTRQTSDIELARHANEWNVVVQVVGFSRLLLTAAAATATVV